MRFTRLGVGCVLLLAAQASAGTLQPKKASEVVALTTSGAVCPGFPGALLIDQQITADGALVAFAVPAKRVLVLTALKVAASGAGPIANHGIEAIALAGTAPPYGGLWVLTGRADADGSVSIHEEIPSGIVVRAGASLCMAALDVTAGSTPASNVGRFVYGFLASDK